MILIHGVLLLFLHLFLFCLPLNEMQEKQNKNMEKRETENNLQARGEEMRNNFQYIRKPFI